MINSSNRFPLPHKAPGWADFQIRVRDLQLRALCGLRVSLRSGFGSFPKEKDTGKSLLPAPHPGSRAFISIV